MDVEAIRRMIRASGWMGKVEELDPAKDLERQGLDSLDRYNVFLQVEEAAGVKFTDEEVEKLRSIDDILRRLAPPA